MKAKLWLKCACGTHEMVRCADDDSTHKVATDHGWQVCDDALKATLKESKLKGAAFHRLATTRWK